MINRILTAATGLLILFSLLFLVRAGVTNGAPEGVDDLAGPLIFWHSWQGEQAAFLQQMIDRFEEENPGVRVVVVALPEDELLFRYAAAARNGFGPDLFLGPAAWIVELEPEGLLRHLSDLNRARIAGFFATDTLRTVQRQGKLYGLPFALHTSALYYNKDELNRSEVQRPARTLDELLIHAGDGAGVGINTGFEGALWGLGASGGTIYDETGDIALDVQSLTSWLTWLRNAQDNISFVMSTNQDGLRNLFVDGGLTYLVDDSTALPALAETLSAESIGVVGLPSGPGGDASPLLRTEALFFSPISSARQQKLAEEAALYLVDREEQTLLMRRAGIVPAHRGVRINSRLNPAAAAFAGQARSALPWTADPVLAWLLQAGNETYIQALDGILSPREAAEALQERLQATFPKP